MLFRSDGSGLLGMRLLTLWKSISSRKQLIGFLGVVQFEEAADSGQKCGIQNLPSSAEGAMGRSEIKDLSHHNPAWIKEI